MTRFRLVVAALSVALVAGLAPAAPGAIRIAKIFYNSPGSDNRSNASLNKEWIRLKNTGKKARSLEGWRVRDKAGRVYRFGDYTLGAGKTVTLHTGSGSNGAAHRYWGSGNYIWNNDKDTATVRNAGGKVVDKCAYDNASASFTMC